MASNNDCMVIQNNRKKVLSNSVTSQDMDLPPDDFPGGGMKVGVDLGLLFDTPCRKQT